MWSNTIEEDKYAPTLSLKLPLNLNLNQEYDDEGSVPRYNTNRNIIKQKQSVKGLLSDRVLLKGQ